MKGGGAKQQNTADLESGPVSTGMVKARKRDQNVLSADVGVVFARWWHADSCLAVPASGTTFFSLAAEEESESNGAGSAVLDQPDLRKHEPTSAVPTDPPGGLAERRPARSVLTAQPAWERTYQRAEITSA